MHGLTSCKCKDIFQGSTDFHPGDISSGVDPKVWTRKQTLQLSGKLLVLRIVTMSQCMPYGSRFSRHH